MANSNGASIPVPTNVNPAWITVPGTAMIIAGIANFPAASSVPGVFAIDSNNGNLYLAFNNVWNFIVILAG